MSTYSLEDLVNADDPGWPIVQSWIQEAKNKVIVLPTTDNDRSYSLIKTQVTTRSPLGAIVYESGGLLVDSGWIRILGSGNSSSNSPSIRSISDWNEFCMPSWPNSSPYTLVADDVIGGFFAVDSGELGDSGSIFYLAPETMNWENTNTTYSEFLDFCFNGNLDDFYAQSRWIGWEKEVAYLSGDQVVMTVPPLWYKPIEEGKNDKRIERKRKIISIKEMYSFALDINRQIKDLPNGSLINLKTDLE